MKKELIIPVLVLASAFIISAIISPVSSKIEFDNQPSQGMSITSNNDLKPFSQSNSQPLNANKQDNMNERKLTASELNKLKSQIGVFEKGKQYNIVFNDRGTGVQPPTAQEWTELASTLSAVDSISSSSDLPSKVDQSATPWFPPIGNQGLQGSCVAWSVGYYVKTFQEAKEHNWDLSNATWDSNAPSKEYQNRIMSPAFVYNLENQGTDSGMAYGFAFDLIGSIGECSWEKMPYLETDYTTWPAQEAWIEASLYRGKQNSYHYMALSDGAGLSNLKNWIAQGNLATISINANEFPSLTSADCWTLETYSGLKSNHANTIVGYDDTISYSEGGKVHTGAFKVANSWGIGGWEKVPDGYYWISYEAMKQRVAYCLICEDVIAYMPELAASFKIAHNLRSECTVEIGLGNPSNPLKIKSFNQHIDGGAHPFCNNEIVIDITEFKDILLNTNQQFFLRVYDGGTAVTGRIESFSIEYSESMETPTATVNGNYITLIITLPPFASHWSESSTINFDQDSIDHKVATSNDSIGNIYAVYTDLLQLTEKTAIFVSKSSDAGQTWTTLTCGYDASYNLGNPSIAVDPYNGEVYVAMEREVTSADYDILVLSYVSGQWSWSSVSDIKGQNHRFPSITNEHKSGVNSQYITYEYVNGNDDRDLMFAKSIDHGSTWMISCLHGNALFEWDVYSQTCITSAGGNLYVAYRYGADYSSDSEIRVERSTDGGSSWVRATDVDGFSNDCQNPFITSTSDGSTLLVGFEYESSSHNRDIWYSYSTNRGDTWTKQQPLFISSRLDERSVSLITTQDGRIHAICKAGLFCKYATTTNLQLSQWSEANIIHDEWIGKGLALGVHSINNINYPYVIWSDAKTKNVYFNDYGKNTSINCSLSSSSIKFGESINATVIVDAPVSDGLINIEYSYDNSSWNNILSAPPHLGSVMCNWSPPNIGDYYIKAEWSGDINYRGSTSQIQQLSVLATHIITTDPSGLSLVVDGINYTSPCVFNWSSGSVHTISSPTIQNTSPTSRYIWSSWNDTGAQSHTIVVDAVGKTFTAAFTTQYYLTLTSAIDTISSGAGWYDAGSTVEFETPATLPSAIGSQYIFLSWTGTGTGSYTGPSIKQTVTMNNAITETANWQTQHLVTFSNNPSDSGTTIPSGIDTWQNDGPISIIANPASGYEFLSWTTSGSISVDQYSSSNTAAHINGPGKLTANFALSATATPQPTSTPLSNPNPTPTPTSNPTSNPTTKPTQTLNPNNETTPTPTVPEASYIGIITLLLTITIVCLFTKRKAQCLKKW